MDKHDALRQFFGHTAFRTGQAELIDHLTTGCDVLGIMPTGAGKSVCYQVPALLLDGLTLVVSPLISLMQDQVSALREAGIPAACLHSGLDAQEYGAVLRCAAQGEFRLLYVAPERLMNETFVRFAQSVPIALVTVDEAHCVSQWGQDFRPGYLKIAAFLALLPQRPVVGAFTATATAAVREDICRLLELRTPFVRTTGFDRENLTFSVQKPRDKFGALCKIIAKHSGQAGIVYCLTRKTVEEVCERLSAAGISATRYHAGLSDTERRENQEDFLYDRRSVMVATNAFGMGIDKSNVSYVVHYNMPKNPESYYQEAGRAGRDGEPAACVLLYSGQDVRTNLFLIDNGNERNDGMTAEERAQVRAQDRVRLQAMTHYCCTTDCLRACLLRYFGETPSHYCGNCSNCLTQFERVDMTVEAQKIVSCVYRLRQRERSFGKAMLVELLRGSRNERITQQGLQTLSTYGILADVPARTVRTMLDSLVEQGYLAIGGGEYPVVELNAASARLLREKPSLSISLPKAPSPSERARKEGAIDGEDMVLFGILRTLRNRLATEAHVPAYVVFTDASLRVMCRRQPTDTAAFLQVAGVGERKAAKYGAVFCEAIAAYLAEQKAQPDAAAG